MSAAAPLAGLAGICAVLAAWEAIAAAEEERLLRSIRRWLASALAAVRSGREPTSPERRRLVALGALSLLGGGWLVAGPWVGLALGAAAPWAARRVVRARRRRRAADVAAAAPAIARAVADALAGGCSVRGALIAAAAGGGVPGPAGEELRVAACALHLGERTEDVLRALARRSRPQPGHGPLDTLVAAVLLQREAGGDLAALLRDLAAALEQRGRVVADARSATAQARFTALLVTGLPAAGLALGELAQPGFVLQLASSSLTASMVVLALMLQAVAFVCVRRIARIGEPR
jgi:tight adherence protein B